MDNRQRLIDMVKGNGSALKIYVHQPDGRYKYFDEVQQKTIGQSLTLSQLKEPKIIVDEATAMMMMKLRNL